MHLLSVNCANVPLTVVNVGSNKSVNGKALCDCEAGYS